MKKWTQSKKFTMLQNAYNNVSLLPAHLDSNIFRVGLAIFTHRPNVSVSAWPI